MHVGALCGALLITSLTACTTAAPPANSYTVTDNTPPAPHAILGDRPQFARLPNLKGQKTPVRIGLILPFGSQSASVRHLSDGLLNAAQMALYDAGNKNIILMTADSHGTRTGAASAARALLGKGAEVLVGPLFSSSVQAVTPIARDHGVPVIAFSTNRKVAGAGIYLMSFQPENEISHIVKYAIHQGHKRFAALIPATAYGHLAENAFRADVAAAGGQITDIEHFNPASGKLSDQAQKVAQSGADAIFLPESGSTLNTMTSVLAFHGASPDKVKYLGTGLWNGNSTLKNSLLQDAWFASPAPDANADFNASYLDTFGTNAPTLASLSYDAVSLVSLLAGGTPYHRFVPAAITDPNGFSGVSGLFRFRRDGTIQRGLAVLAVEPDGFTIVSPAPKSFRNSTPRS